MLVIESKSPDGRLLDHILSTPVVLGGQGDSPIPLPPAAGRRAAKIVLISYLPQRSAILLMAEG